MVQDRSSYVRAYRAGGKYERAEIVRDQEVQETIYFVDPGSLSDVCAELTREGSSTPYRLVARSAGACTEPSQESWFLHADGTLSAIERRWEDEKGRTTSEVTSDPDDNVIGRVEFDYDDDRDDLIARREYNAAGNVVAEDRLGRDW